MTDSVLDKYSGGRKPASEPAAESDGAEDLGSFGWLRGVRDRAVMLELRLKNGNVTAIGYAWIERVEFDPSDGITLHALGKEIRIKGRNLNAEARPTVRLFDGIVRHRVPWLRQSGDAEATQAGDSSTVIDTIEL